MERYLNHCSALHLLYFRMNLKCPLKSSRKWNYLSLRTDTKIGGIKDRSLAKSLWDRPNDSDLFIGSDISAQAKKWHSIQGSLHHQLYSNCHFFGRLRFDFMNLLLMMVRILGMARGIDKCILFRATPGGKEILADPSPMLCYK